VAMWENAEYVDQLLITSPLSASFLFFSTEGAVRNSSSSSAVRSSAAEAFARGCRRIVEARMEALRFPVALRESWLARLFFAVDPIEAQGSFLPQILAENEFRSSLQHILYKIGTDDQDSTVIERLDPRWPWLPSPEAVLGSTWYPVVYVGDACTRSPLTLNGTGRLALIDRSSSTKLCNYAEKLLNAARTGAVGGVVVNDIDTPLVDMNCDTTFCFSPNITGTMIRATPGQHLVNAIRSGQSVYIKFQTSSVPGFDLTIDSNWALQQAGFLMYPSFAFLGWNAQFYRFAAARDRALNSLASNMTTFPIFTDQLMNGTATVTVESMPSVQKLSQQERIVLDLALRCPTAFDSSCPAWDRTIQLAVTCTDNETSTIAHWINPFGRGIGRWLTDITALVPLLATTDGRCTFELSGVMVNEVWMPKLNLLMVTSDSSGELDSFLSNPFSTSIEPSPSTTSAEPFQTLLLFVGGHLNDNYTSSHPPVNFNVPLGTTRVEMYAIIDGHGGADHNCAEFCETSHTFTFNGHTNRRSFSDAGSAFGCANRTPIGVVPNQYGTWLYGRDGWCDGLEVIPWRQDITSQLFLQANRTNTASYTALVVGKPPTGNEGYIVMQTYLSFFR